MIVMVLIFAFRKFNFFKRNNIKIKDTLSDLGYWVVFLFLVICPIIMLDLQSFVFAFRSIVSVLMSFGGGDAYLVIADGLFVDDMVSEDTFYNNIISVVNILPGSILGKTLSCVGYYFGLDFFGNYLGSIFMAIAVVELQSVFLVELSTFSIHYMMNFQLQGLPNTWQLYSCNYCRITWKCNTNSF